MATKPVVASHIYLNFSLLDLIKKKITLNKIEIEDGKVFLVKNKYNQVNFSFLKEDTTSSTFSVNLKEITVENSSFTFIDINKQFVFQSVVKYANLNGILIPEQFDANISIDLEKAKLNYNRKQYFSSVVFSGKVNVSRSENGDVEFKSKKLVINHLKIETNVS